MDENLTKVFKQLKGALKKYSPPLIVKNNTALRYELQTNKKVVIAGRKRDDVYFAGIVIQSNFVGFYYMPVYTNPVVKKKLKKEMMATLKGKSCFHIKKLDVQLFKQIEYALKVGYAVYKKEKWI